MVRQVGGRGLRRRPTARNGRAVLNPETIVDTCVDLVTDHDRQALTVAAVARALEVSPRSIYHYFSTRRALLAAVIERTQHDLPLPVATGDWRADLRRYRDQLMDYQERHRAVLEITEVEGVYVLSERYHTVVEAALMIFTEIGLDTRTAYLCYGEFARWIGAAHRYLRPLADDKLFDEVVSSGHRAAESRSEERRLTAAAGVISSAEQIEFGFELLLDSFAQLANRSD